MTRGTRTIVGAVVALAIVAGVGWLIFGGGSDGPVVNVYSARSHYGTEAVFDRFTEETGIKVEIYGGEPGPLVDRITAEGERTKADLLITTDAGFLWKAAEDGLLAPVKSAALEKAVPANLRDPQDRWFAIAERARTIMRSTERVPEAQAPATYAALGDARWKGKLCLRTSNNVYNQSLVATLIADRGEDAARTILESWMANDPIILGADTEVLDAIKAGRCDVGLTNTYYLGNKLKDDPSFPVAPVWAEQGSGGTHVNVSGVGLTTAASAHKADAIKLMEYLLTPEAQRLIAEGNSEFPVLKGVQEAEWIRGWGDFTADARPIVRAGEYQAQAVQLMNAVGWK
ncbi:MAG: extracellular solute-binding protein [Thermoleophilia bacterium]